MVMKQPAFDLDLDKHLNATLVVACDQCGHEIRHHLKSLAPDSVLACGCGAHYAVTQQYLARAQRRLDDIKSAYRVAA